MNDMAGRRPLRRALISVFDKTQLSELATGLSAAGVDIVSTGSTASTIRQAGIEVTEVAEITGFPECLDGRVKTLHPRIHAGILADTSNADHLHQLQDLDIETFDLVVCNLYPFEQTVASGATHPEIIEKIDIGGPSMVRAAAKNHGSVAVVVNPAAYAEVLTAVSAEGFTLGQRQELAAAAFAHTAGYDAAVAAWTAEHLGADTAEKAAAGSAEQAPLIADQASVTTNQAESAELSLPDRVELSLTQLSSLRYGENSHQSAALYYRSDAPQGLAQARVLHGKPMSYNNYVDTDAALRTAYDFAEPAVAIIKHANPCGVARAESVQQAYHRAHSCDPVSAFGGVIAANREVGEQMALAVAEVFTEVIIAPGFSPSAREILTRKKNIRVIELPADYQRESREFRQISGGMLLQDADAINDAGDNPQNWNLVAGSPAPSDQFADLIFAWRAVRAVKSNAILLARDNATVGIGMGQVNRLDSSRLAVQRANSLAADHTERARGSVAASDAFFPFADGLQILIDAGVRAVVQPGGSQRDAEVIEAAQAAGITMYFTGTRHFFH